MRKNNYIYILILLMPFVDLASSLSNRISPDIISLGIVVKSFIILLSIFYIVFISKSKYRRISIVYLLMIFAYIALYFLFKNDLLDIDFIKQEMNYLFKFIYFPVLFFGLLNYFDNNGFEKNKMNNMMISSFIAYILIIAIPTIFKINFGSYVNSGYFGSVGWFYSANEISTILLLMFPFIYTLLSSHKIITFIIYAFGLYATSLVGTKVTLFGIIIVTTLLFICGILKSKKISKNNIIMFLMCVVTIVFMINNYSAMNLRSSLSEAEVKDIENLSKELDAYYQDNKIFKEIKKIGSTLLSSRDVYAINTYKMFTSNYKAGYYSLGMGFTNTNRINNIRVEKLIEIDFLDIFFHMGFLAILLISFPFLYLLFYMIKHKSKDKVERFFFIMVILMTLGISSTAGHTLIAPAVSLYLGIYFIYLFDNCKSFDKKNINNKKIAILALHMGYGGVENVIANKANMLVNDYDVEIISLYKQRYSIPFKLDKRVMVTYLMNDVSNKEKFKRELKNKNLIKIIKEGIRSLKILLNKNKLITNAICNSDAKVIISTRIEFSEILERYKRNDVITIHEQHVYNINDDYIKELNNLRIDYIMPVSKVLEKKYKETIGDRVKYIPLTLNNYPCKSNVSKLNNNNIVAVGRLEAVKAFDDLIDVMSIVAKENKNVRLNICGNGSQMDNLKKKIKDLHLGKFVSLLGFQHPKDLEKIYQKSSLYALTSYEESFGLVVVEAMSFGIPCIMFDSAKGPLECVNNKNGFIINNRNKEQMAEQILNYFKLPIKERRNIGIECRLISKNYDCQNVKGEWIKFIDDISKTNGDAK